MRTLLTFLGLYLPMILSGQKVVTDPGVASTLKVQGGAKAIIVIFADNKCPYIDYYQDRILDLSENAGVPVRVIYTGNAAMVEAFSGLDTVSDPDGSVRKALNASKVPEAFLLSNTSSGLEVIYQGAIDDNPQVEADVGSSYLMEAVQLYLKNERPEDSYIRASGCVIR